MSTHIAPASAMSARITYTTRGGYEETVYVPGPLVVELIERMRAGEDVQRPTVTTSV